MQTLKKRVRWYEDDKSVKVGDLLLLREDSVKRVWWPLGRIEQVHPGQDGIVRVVHPRTNTEVYVRPVVKVHPFQECYIDEVPQGGGGDVTESI